MDDTHFVAKLEALIARLRAALKNNDDFEGQRIVDSLLPGLGEDDGVVILHPTPQAKSGNGKA
jgi:hypothetical protein